jgi:hypothetical protein
MKWIQELRAARLRRTSPWQAALADLPAGLQSYWRASAPREYEGIPTDAFFFARAAEGLLRFFDAVRHSGRPCALPSEAADSVWHAWLRWNPVSLERFCVRHFALFGLDALLRMPGGHGYWSRAGEIVYARLNERGRGMWRARPHPELALAVLYAAGVVDRHLLAAHLGRREAGVDGGSCGGMVFADGGDACADGGGSDGGGDGGSSGCGSSCGGGCGGD